METNTPTWTLGALAEMLGGELQGLPDLPLDRPVDCASSDPRGVAFAESEEYLREAEESQVGAVILPRGMRPTSLPAIYVDQPRLAFLRLLNMARRPLPLSSGIHPSAVVAEGAEVHPDASVGPFAVVERGAVVGRGCRIYPFCYVGENCVVGEESILFPHVVLYQDVRIGARSILHAGAVLGADGFGFFWDGTRRVKVPQVGGVVLGDDCEVGAMSAIDRATAGTTTLGDGNKIDNLVQIGHNTRIGDHGAIAALTGIGGSSRLGDRVLLAGQCAVADHVTVGDDVTFAGRTAAGQDVEEPGIYLGAPARPIREASRALLLATKLPELFSRLRRLEKRFPDSP
jgi:UDP-3-O-[3-hydroxymyristoyl] glucosamine N-acyltransferase